MGMMARVPGSLKALLAYLIDYAGLYPPAALPLGDVVANYALYRDSADSWLLNRLVLPMAKLSETPVEGGWRVTLLVEEEPGRLSGQIETLETKQARRLSLPTYCEAALNQIRDAFAKFRTGGLTPEGIPSCSEISDFLREAAARRVPFKATAGLHHPLRSTQALTYSVDSPRAPMHGFINVFVAAAFAWHGAGRSLLVEVLEESAPAAFQFCEHEMRWRDRRLSAAELSESRREFAHSFGSCSFEEPVTGLRELGWLS